MPADGSAAPDLSALESKLGYQFQDQRQLLRALTHRSRAAESSGSREGDNERLEFLGDSILGFVASEQLVMQNPGAREGLLSRLKAHLVSSEHLYQCALQLDLGSFLVLGKGEERNGGRARKALLADALEAIIAAIYLDGGLEPAKSFISSRILLPTAATGEGAFEPGLDRKGSLQEKVQALGLPLPVYEVVALEGPEHARVFVVEANIGASYSARGSGTSKKSASQAAAELLLTQLGSAAQS